MATWDQIIDKIYSKYHSNHFFSLFFDADDKPQAVSHANPMPVIVTGGVTIEGDVIVDSVGIDQSQQGVSNAVAVVASVLAEDAATETTLAALDAKTPALGQALASASVPVVLPDAQLTALQSLTDTELRATPVIVSLPDAATAIKQDTTNTALTDILAKLLTAPATEAKQDTGNGALANILAKLIAAPATEAKQDASITQETAINTILGTVTASPTANTLADRLKQLLTGIVLSAGSALIGKVGIDQTPGADSVTVKAAGTFAPATASSSAAYEAGRVISATPITFIGLIGYNSKNTAQFIQVHDASSAPADTAVPKFTIKAEPLSNFFIDPAGEKGVSLSTGFYVCNSSTGPTKTIGAADCWFTGVYK
jgi:hypothetical protein